MHIFKQMDFQNLSSDITIITANRRLSALYLKQHQQYQMNKGETWSSLDILPFQSWLQRLWQQETAKNIENFPRILHPNQEQILWEEIIRESPHHALLQITATAEMAKSAWQTLKQWLVDPNDSIFNVTTDTQVFQQWAKQFHKICRQENWLDTASLPDLLIKKIQAGEIHLPKNLLLVGFTELSPQQKKLFATCQTVGTEVTHHVFTSNNKTTERIGLLDEETEIRTMARTAKMLLNQHPDNFKMGCIIPNLETIRDRVIQIFSEVLTEKNTYTIQHITLPFNISAGKSLNRYPIIHAALQLLNWQEEISMETLSHILRSPYLGEAEQERWERAQLDYRLRRENKNVNSLSDLMLSSHTIPPLSSRAISPPPLSSRAVFSAG